MNIFSQFDRFPREGDVDLNRIEKVEALPSKSRRATIKPPVIVLTSSIARVSVGSSHPS
jgi:hypothetical protein